MKNKSLCKHKEFKFAYYYTTPGYTKPIHNIVFYCVECCKIKVEKIKDFN